MPDLVSDALDQFSAQQIKQFLRLCTFGSMDTDASALTGEEQQLLFDGLYRLHQHSGIDMRGIWGIISLNFRNRSGLVLLMLFKNSNILTSQMLNRKSFLKDIEFLENPKPGLTNISRILQILDISVDYFVQKLRASKDSLKQIQESQKKTAFVLSEARILEENDYDSEPDNNLYRKPSQDQQDTVLRRFSVFLPPVKVQYQDQSQFDCQETISIKKRLFTPYPTSVPRQRKRRAHRPDPKTRKTRLVREINSKQTGLINFVSTRKDKMRLRGTYRFLRKSRRKQSQDEQSYSQTPKRPEGQARGPGRSRRGENSRHGTSRGHSFRRSRMQQESSQLPYGYHTEEVQVQDLIEQPDSPDNLALHRIRRHNRAHSQAAQTFSHMDSESNQLEHSMQQQVGILGRDENVGEIEITHIIFPTQFEDLAALGCFREQDKYVFNCFEWHDYLNALSQKEMMAKIRELAAQKHQGGTEQILSLCHMCTNASVSQQLYQAYLRPLLGHKLTLAWGGVLAEVISCLYTYNSGISRGVGEACKQLLLPYCQLVRQDAMQTQKFKQLVLQALKDLVADMREQSKQTQAMIGLPSPLEAIRPLFRLRLGESGLIEGILIAVFISVHSFAAKLFGMDTGHPSLASLFKEVHQCYEARVSDKVKFVGLLARLYRVFEIPVATKQQFTLLLKFTEGIDLGSSRQEDLYQILPGLARNFIEHRLRKEPNFNFKHVLNYIFQNSFMDKCKSLSGQVPQQILVRTYLVLISYPKFHNEMTLRQVTHFCASVGFGQIMTQERLQLFIELFTKCYTIALGPDSNSKLIKNGGKLVKTQLVKGIQSEISRFLGQVTQKYSEYAQRSCEISIGKRRKFESILDSFIDGFINSDVLGHSFEHYTFSLQCLLVHFYPLFCSATQSKYIGHLSNVLINKIYRFASLRVVLTRQLQDQIEALQACDQDEQEEGMEKFLQLKQFQAGLTDQLLKKVMEVFDEAQVAKKMPKQFLSLLNSKSWQEKVFYEAQGAVTLLVWLNQSNHKQIMTSVLQFLASHAKSILIQKCEQMSMFYLSSNRLVLEFMKGMFKAISCFHCHSEAYRRLQKAGEEVMQSMMDILFLGLVCDRDTRSVVDLIGLIELKHFVTCHNLIPRLTWPPREGSPAILDVRGFYGDIWSMHDRRMITISAGTFTKFKTTYLKAWRDLFSKYDEMRWTQQRSHLAFALLSTYLFLIKVDAPQDVTRQYRPFFAISSLEPKNSGSSPNYLKSLEINESHREIVESVIELFEVCHTKKRQNFDATRKLYCDYITTLAIESSPHSPEFTKLRVFIEVLHSRQQPQQSNPHCFELLLCQSLLSSFWAKCLLQEGLRERAVGFYFSLCRDCPAFSSVYLQFMSQSQETMDKAIKCQANPQLACCQNLQDAIRKYVLNRYCDFGKLYRIVEQRMRNPAQLRKNKSACQQLHKIIQRSVSLIKEQGLHPIIQSELTAKYEALLKSTVERLEHSKINFPQLAARNDRFAALQPSNPTHLMEPEQ